MLAQAEMFKRNGKISGGQSRNCPAHNHDIEMLRRGRFLLRNRKNYSRYFDGRNPGMPLTPLMDFFFSKDYLLFVDESHVTLPQVRGMYNGDKARKKCSSNMAFRLPAAADNRPLKFDEFNQRIGQAIYLSATPAEYEKPGGIGSRFAPDRAAGP